MSFIRSKIRRLNFLYFLLPFLFLGAFFFYPLGKIWCLSLSQVAEPGLQPCTSLYRVFFLTFVAITDLFKRTFILDVIWFTIWQATLSTFFTLIIGLPVAYLFARYDFRGKTIIRSLTTVPFVMPTVVVAAAFRALLGANGLLNQLLVSIFHLDQVPIRLDQTITIILMAHVFYNVTVVVRLVGGFWANLSPRLIETAQVLGASSSRAFWEVTLPLLQPALISASILIYLFTFTSFGVILILGGPSFSTVETEIYRQFVTFLRPDLAAALSLVQILFTFALMLLYARWQHRSIILLDLHPQRVNLKRVVSRAQKLFAGVSIGILFILLISPMLALFWRSLVDREGQLTLAYYQALPELKRGSIVFIPPLTAIRNSLGYALLTILTAGLIGVLTAVLLTQPSRWRRWLDPIFMLPLGVSAVTLGFGYVVSYDRLRTSPWLVLIAHTLVAFPFVVRSILPVLQGIKPGLREAATVMGASPAQVWREIDLPIVGRALLVAAVFAFTISMGEFGATSFIVRSNSGYLTLPIAIQRYLSQPGALNFGQALAMSSILMMVCVVGFVAIERFRYADIGEF